MAKLTAPLLSFDARGALGKTLVFIGWKGIKSCRQFVIPANPKSVAQVLQRGYMALTVAAWKLLDSVDKAGWNTASSIAATPMSGFNVMTRHAIASLKDTAPSAAPMGRDFTLVAGSLQVTVDVEVRDVNDGTWIDASSDFDVVYGTDIRDMSTSGDLVQTGGAGTPYILVVTPLTAGVLYYFKIVDSVEGNDLSGILTATPTA